MRFNSITDYLIFKILIIMWIIAWIYFGIQNMNYKPNSLPLSIFFGILLPVLNYRIWTEPDPRIMIAQHEKESKRKWLEMEIERTKALNQFAEVKAKQHTLRQITLDGHGIDFFKFALKVGGIDKALNILTLESGKYE
jgi:hypothetical protein